MMLVFLEMLLRKPLFPGVSPADQLAKIFETLGTPTEVDMPNYSGLPEWKVSKGCIQEEHSIGG